MAFSSFFGLIKISRLILRTYIHPAQLHVRNMVVTRIEAPQKHTRTLHTWIRAVQGFDQGYGRKGQKLSENACVPLQ